MLVLTVPTLAWSQAEYVSNWKASAFLGIGTASYYGDLNPSSISLDISPAVTIGGAYYFKRPDRLSLRAELTYYRIAAADSDSDDPSRNRRNLSFAANNLEFNLSGVISLFPEPVASLYSRNISRRSYNAYAFLGVGVTSVNPTAELNGTRYNLPDFNTEKVEYGSVALVVPVGIGLKYKLNHDWAVLGEVGYRLAFTDYLDDVSTTYPGQEAFASPTAAALSDRRPEIGLEPRPAGSTRGNPDRNDGYMIISIRVEYLGLASLITGGNPYNIDRSKGPRSRPYD